jgi:hypothetical protein
MLFFSIFLILKKKNMHVIFLIFIFISKISIAKFYLEKISRVFQWKDVIIPAKTYFEFLV